jgi:S1-C subfamily serine protease
VKIKGCSTDRKEGQSAGLFQRCSTAGKAGLNVGDILLNVDRKPVSDLSLLQIQKMFMLDGHDRMLSGKRGDERLQNQIA